MINFEELTAYLISEKSKTLKHAEHYRRKNDPRQAAELTRKATAYTDVLDFIGQYACPTKEVVDAKRTRTMQEGTIDNVGSEPLA